MANLRLPRAESLILLAFLGCVALWAISKCSDKRSALVRQVRELGPDDDTEERPVRHDTVVVKPTTVQQPVQQQPVAAAPVQQPAPAQYTTTQRQPGPTPDQPAPLPGSAAFPKPSATPAAKPTAPAVKSGATLYVTIDGLKVRKEPGLKGETVEQLKLYDPVTFLNQKTEWTQEISLGYEKVTDHWVKVKTVAGKTGWVFGAGVHYYKMKRSGVIEEGKTPETGKKKQ